MKILIDLSKNLHESHYGQTSMHQRLAILETSIKMIQELNREILSQIAIIEQQGEAEGEGELEEEEP